MDVTMLTSDLPFYELMYFRDDHGTIGPDAATDLAEDFRRLRAKVMSQPQSDPEDEAWFVEQYARWTTAFELASRGRNPRRARLGPRGPPRCPNLRRSRARATRR